jgi:phage baseplate assembly protein W
MPDNQPGSDGSTAPKSDAAITVTASNNEPAKASALPFYKFEVCEITDSGAEPAAEADLQGISPSVLLRIPPSNLRISQPIRAEVSIDLLGYITVAQGGMGLRRWTISGTHGVGKGKYLNGAKSDTSLISAASSGEFVMSGGFAVRQALASLFEAWATANEKRRIEKKIPMRMKFSVLGGTFSEFQNEEWWIQPDGLPEDSRSASRPMAWDWSLSFIALQRIEEGLAKSDGAETLMPPSAREILAKLDAAEAKLDAATKGKKFWLVSLIEKIIAVKALLQKIRGIVSSVVSYYRATVKAVSDFVRSCARLVQEILLLVNRSNLFDQPKRDLANALLEVRTACGFAAMLSQGYLHPYQPTSASRLMATVQPGDTIQSVSYRELGTSTRWQELVSANGLVYPYLDFSGPNGAKDSIYDGMSVLGKGDTIKLPSTAGDVIPTDPIGTDMSEAGDVGVLVGGIENLRGALLRRLRTPKGYLPHHPTYGSNVPNYLGKPLTPSLVLSLRAEVRRALLEDPRIISVDRVGVKAGLDDVYVEVSATTAMGPLSVGGTVGGTVQA